MIFSCEIIILSNNYTTDQKDVDEELGIKDVEAGEMPAEEEEMLEDMPVDWSIVACSVIFGLGLGNHQFFDPENRGKEKECASERASERVRKRKRARISIFWLSVTNK